MTTASMRLLRLVSSRFPETEVAGKAVVLRPTEHIVRGITLERTVRKGEFYLWSIIVPLFAPIMRSMTLNYSERVLTTDAPGGLVQVGALKSSDMIAEILSASELIRLHEISSPHQFLRVFEPRGHLNRPNIALEFAVAHCIAGNVDVGRKVLNDVLNWAHPTPILSEVQSKAKLVLDAIADGRGALAALVSSFEQANVNAHFPGLTRF